MIVLRQERTGHITLYCSALELRNSDSIAMVFQPLCLLCSDAARILAQMHRI